MSARSSLDTTEDEIIEDTSSNNILIESSIVEFDSSTIIRPRKKKPARILSDSEDESQHLGSSEGEASDDNSTHEDANNIIEVSSDDSEGGDHEPQIHYGSDAEEDTDLTSKQEHFSSDYIEDDSIANTHSDDENDNDKIENVSDFVDTSGSSKPGGSNEYEKDESYRIQDNSDDSETDFEDEKQNDEIENLSDFGNTNVNSEPGGSNQYKKDKRYRIQDNSDDSELEDPSFQSNLDDDDEKENHVTVKEKSFSIERAIADDSIVRVNNVTLQNGIYVDRFTYQQQLQMFNDAQDNMMKTQNFMRSINLDNLPDKGLTLKNMLEDKRLNAEKLKSELDNMQVFPAEEKGKMPLQPIVPLENLQEQINIVQPRTFGKQAMETHNAQKAMTLDRLEQLHLSLQSCPDATTYATDPKGLKVELMPHQKHAVAWLMWRELQKPSGGILADDMGLGKTLTMIALVLKVNEAVEDKDHPFAAKMKSHIERCKSKYPGGTLVICPATLIHQWNAEIQKRLRSHLISTYLYHGANRETRAKRLAKQDVVITTYALAMGDGNKSGPLLQIKWRRIILDEAHQVRNHKSQTSEAICSLSAMSRWALTGTPIHNKELDLYALLKFLRCTPFDNLAVWKSWVANKTTGGQDRLHTVMSSLLLRRTKQQLEEKGALTCLPAKSWEIVNITLEKSEMDIYQKVLIFSRTLFAQFLHQRLEKNDAQCPPQSRSNEQYYAMHRRLVASKNVQQVHQHDILVLLLRLRQICCHPSLITGMLDGGENAQDFEESHEGELDLLEQLNKLSLNDQQQDVQEGLPAIASGSEVGLSEASRNLLNPFSPIFAESRHSSKIKVILKIVEELPKGEKIIIVSQWKKMLDLCTIPLKERRMKFFQLDGSVPVPHRMGLLQQFNDPSNKIQILLLSLTAGGVGLNLVGANHLILVDLHWNPQLEIQAQDRIYRVGQTKPVKIYKLIASDTIEERIKFLQTQKMELADEVLTGTKIQRETKLSLADLKMLFNM